MSDSLSPREIELVQFVGKGLRNKEIAHIMGVTEWTVKKYMSHIMKKLRLDSRTKVGLFARGVSILMALAAVLSAQTLTIVGPPGNVKAGSTVVFTVSLSGSASLNVAAAETALPNLGTPVCTAGSSAIAASKSVTCGVIGGNVVVLVAGINANVMADGPIANVQMTIPPTAPAGTQSEGLTTLSAASAAGISLPVVAGSPFTYAIISITPCDINGDGVTDSKDFAAAQTQITTGVGTGVDLTGDGKFDSVDLQRIANAITTGVCKVGAGG